MKELIKRLAGKFYSYRLSCRWRRETRIERAKLQYDNTIKQDIDGQCLILIPHSDDEWIGCSQIIKSNKEVVLCNMDMEGGDNDSLHRIRYEEMSRVAQHYQRKLVTLNDDKVEGLRRIIKECECTHIFLPHYIDWHPDHVAVMRLLAAALGTMSKKETKMHVVMYQVSCPVINGINLAIPMTKKDCKMKWSFFKSHYPTQQHIPYQRFYCNEVINGKYLGAYAAEVYVTIDAGVWLSALEKKLPDERQSEKLRNNLGSISAMRSFITSEMAG